MKKMKKSRRVPEEVPEKMLEMEPEETAVEADDLVSIAEAIKAKAPKATVKAAKPNVVKPEAKPAETGLFADLLKQVPKGWKNMGIAAFIRKHFKQVVFVRGKRYSWTQIAEVVEAELKTGSRNLPKSLSNAFFRERHRGDL